VRLVLLVAALTSIAVVARRRLRRAPAPDLAPCVESVLVGVQAGLTVPQALEQSIRWLPRDSVAPVRRCADALAAGDPPRLALAPLATLDGGRDLADVLARAMDDGLPLTDVLATLLASARAARRRAAESRIRALPARLTLPVVACVLPSFVLLGVVPLAIALGPALGWPAS